jgi:7-carboxy-7-deazaguanine synthase
MTAIKVSEIFGPTLQGEGALIGQPTVFVRTGGCDFRCVWCDTLYAVLPEHKQDWTPMEAEDILKQIHFLTEGRGCWITLSGGNPAMQPLGELIVTGSTDYDYKFVCETQGTLAPDWFGYLDMLVLSPKPPSSEMKFKPHLLEKCIEAATTTEENPEVILKIVVFDDADFAFATEVHAMKQFRNLPLYLQAGNHTPFQDDEVDVDGIIGRTKWLADKVFEHGFTNEVGASITVLPQLHTIMFGNERGV